MARLQMSWSSSKAFFYLFFILSIFPFVASVYPTSDASSTSPTYSAPMTIHFYSPGTAPGTFTPTQISHPDASFEKFRLPYFLGQSAYHSTTSATFQHHTPHADPFLCELQELQKAGDKYALEEKKYQNIRAAAILEDYPVLKLINSRVEDALGLETKIVTVEGFQLGVSKASISEAPTKLSFDSSKQTIFSKVAREAFYAAQNEDAIFVKNKHLNIGAGKFAKFATDDLEVARKWTLQALQSPCVLFMENPQISDSFRIVADLGFRIGTRGETKVMAIIKGGRVLNAYPVK